MTFALSNVPVGLAPNFTAPMAARLVGLAHGLLWTTMAPFVSRVVPADKVGKALAIVFSGNSLGLAIGAPLGTALGTLFGWRASFLFLAGFGLLLTGLAGRLLPQVPRIPDAVRSSMRKAIAQPGVKSVAIAWPLLVLAHFALFTYIEPFIREAGLPDKRHQPLPYRPRRRRTCGDLDRGHHRGLPAPPLADHHDGGHRRRDAPPPARRRNSSWRHVLMAVRARASAPSASTTRPPSSSSALSHQGCPDQLAQEGQADPRNPGLKPDLKGRQSDSRMRSATL